MGMWCRSLAFALAAMVSARVAAALPFVYAANADSDDVTVIDAATNLVVTTISVGNEPRNPAASPDGSRVYVPNRFDDNVSVIDGTSLMVLTTIDDASFDEPYSAAVSPDSKTVYTANKKGGGSTTGSVTVIDALSNMVTTTIDDVCFSSPEWVIFNPVLPRAYVVSRGGNSVCVIDTTNNTVIDSVTVGSNPRSAVVTCDGAFVYVANNSGSPSVSKFRTSDNTIVGSGIDFVGGSPRNMAITPDCTKIFVPLQNDTVGLIVTATDTPSTIMVPNGDSTYGAAVTFDGRRAYITDEDDNEVEVIDVATNTVLGGSDLPIPAGRTPRGITTALRAAGNVAPSMSLVGLGALCLLLVGAGFSVLRPRSAART
jgi:YVTN family beta-propeller protein